MAERTVKFLDLQQGDHVVDDKGNDYGKVLKVETHKDGYVNHYFKDRVVSTAPDARHITATVIEESNASAPE